jgi:hypothetical protein
VTCECGNTARYIDSTGALTCAICPLKAGRDSIRIADVPALLAWARHYLRGWYMDEALPSAELRSVIGRDLSTP